MADRARAFSKFRCDLHPSFVAVYNELTALLDHFSPERADRLLELLDLESDFGPHLFLFEQDRETAPVAGELYVRLKPNELLLGFASAVRAADGDRVAIEQAFNHLESSLSPAIVAEHASGPAIRPESGISR